MSSDETPAGVASQLIIQIGPSPPYVAPVQHWRHGRPNESVPILTPVRAVARVEPCWNLFDIGYNDVFRPDRVERGSQCSCCTPPVDLSTGDLPHRMHTSIGAPRQGYPNLAATDSPDAPPVVIISRNVADRFWPGVDPVGQRIKWGRPSAPDEWVTIIGVAEDSRHRSLRSPSWNVYVPYTQSPWQLNHLVVRTVSDPAAVTALLEREVRGLDPSVRTVDVATLDELASTLLRAPRFQSGLLALFGLLALTLGGIGIYGVTAFAGAQRTKEIGIRMALGARRSDLGRLILRETLKLSAAGLAIGGIGAAAAARLLGGMVYNVAPLDGWTFVGVSLLLVTTSLIAAIGPARRATRLDPVEALRAG